jgi:hypothetical protein
MKHFKSANTKKYLADIERLELKRSPKLANDFGFPPDTGYEIYKVKGNNETPEEREYRQYKQHLELKRVHKQKLADRNNNTNVDKPKPQRHKLVYGKKYEGLDYN